MTTLPPSGPRPGDEPVPGSLPPSPPPLFGTRPADLPPVPAGSTPTEPRPRRWQLPLAVVVGVALLLGAFAAGWTLRTSGDDTGSGDDLSASPVTFETDDQDRPTEPPIESDGVEPVGAVAEAVAPAVVQLEVASGL